ncbi:hypothetical protein F0P96_18560 [Hymenobacter busanensis]|uniref:Uncharacterized protein n=1 Tax=Hymenobacter busanensis TaxID=2607656 RepID=A0A7L4ZUP5_9BACT|nr:hypothetical protein [Hymenobacter busanensis]KAA9327236.1 hypothetical protein F0P96_18560 [Hymenobacter busanensis]QHJ05902.1 hypothetical protein GUY19_00765 [Hymenobacter busanensis]
MSNKDVRPNEDANANTNNRKGLDPDIQDFSQWLDENMDAADNQRELTDEEHERLAAKMDYHDYVEQFESLSPAEQLFLGKAEDAFNNLGSMLPDADRRFFGTLSEAVDLGIKNALAMPLGTSGERSVAYAAIVAPAYNALRMRHEATHKQEVDAFFDEMQDALVDALRLALRLDGSTGRS